MTNSNEPFATGTTAGSTCGVGSGAVDAAATAATAAAEVVWSVLSNSRRVDEDEGAWWRAMPCGGQDETHDRDGVEH